MVRKKVMHIQPPPKEPGLYRVVYVIDVGAANVIEAARNAYQMMSDPDSMPPVLEVIDGEGNKTRVDLSEENERITEKFTKITVGFVTQVYEKNAAGKFVCIGQEFIAGDQVDYEDAGGNTIAPPDHKYQPFNMTL
jgi:hypothetical protein